MAHSKFFKERLKRYFTYSGKVVVAVGEGAPGTVGYLISCAKIKEKNKKIAKKEIGTIFFILDNKSFISFFAAIIIFQ